MHPPPTRRFQPFRRARDSRRGAQGDPGLRPFPDHPGHRVHPGGRARRAHGSGLAGRGAALASLRHHLENPQAIGPFAEFGIVLLLFSIGLELSFRRLWGMRRLVLGVRRGGAPARRGADRSGIARTRQQRPGLGRAGPRACLVLYRPRPATGRHDQPGDTRRWRCCCSRIWRSCRSSRRYGALCPAGGRRLGRARPHRRTRRGGRRGDARARAPCCCRACSPRRRGPRARNCSSRSAFWS